MTDDLATAVSERLREAHRSVSRLAISDSEKARLARRLIAISDAAKRDLPAASRRLDRLMAGLQGADPPA